MAKNSPISRTPAELRSAMMSAEKELKRPESGKEETIELTRVVITTRPELFQPRGFANRALDEGHVRKSAQRISTKGELSPPLLVKLGTVLVDETSGDVAGDESDFVCTYIPNQKRVLSTC